MTTYHGKNGVVKAAGGAVGEVQEFTLTETASTADDTQMGDAYETHLIGILAWSGTLKCSLDPADTGQLAMAVGQSVALELYPSTTNAGQQKISGTATITQLGSTVGRSAVNAASFDFKGNGALTKATI